MYYTRMCLFSLKLFSICVYPLSCQYKTGNKRSHWSQFILDNTPGGTTYIRWGRTSCSNTTAAELVYEGYAAGSHYTHSGGGANYVCLPRDPLFEPDVTSGSTSLIYGAEYETNSGAWKIYHNQDVPCAVCRTPRTNVLMLPGRNQCYNDWQLEYTGFLMSDYYGYSSKEYTCVDAYPETLNSGSTNANGALFYFVEARCGALKCPPYIEGREITCAVCSYRGRASSTPGK